MIGVLGFPHETFRQSYPPSAQPANTRRKNLSPAVSPTVPPLSPADPTQILRYLRPCRKPLLAALALLLLTVPLTNLHPFLWGYAVDHILPSKSGGKLLQLLALLVGTYITGLAIRTAYQYLLERAGQRLVRDVRRDVFAKLQRQSLSYHHEHRAGDLVTRAISDIDAMEASVLRGTAQLIEELITFLFVGAFVIWMQPIIGATTILPLALSYIVVRKYNTKVKPIYKLIREKLGDTGAYISDRLSGVQLLQAFGRNTREDQDLATITEHYRLQSVKVALYRLTFYSGVSFVGFATNVVMLGLGIYFIWQDQFTLGGLVAYRGFWWRFQSPINTLAQTSDILQRARASAARIVEILDAPTQIQSPQSPLPIPENPTLTFQSVHFSYQENTPILQDLHFQIHPGEMVILAGSSGSGKSTLLNLIPRFYDPTQGQILLDQTDIKDLSLDQLRHHIGSVTQESYLFNETIQENIRFARPTATDQEVITAARQANAHTFISALPEAYLTKVGERGVKLSGGQRQRISIARTFLMDPKILLLDEPTSSVEPGSEAAIHTALEKLSQGRTTIMATHRTTLLAKATKILFFHQGILQAQGTHQELLTTNKPYASAYGSHERSGAQRRV